MPCGLKRASTSRVARHESYARAIAAPPNTYRSATTPGEPVAKAVKGILDARPVEQWRELLTRRRSRNRRRIRPACATRPGHAPAPEHASPAYRTETKSAAAREMLPTAAHPRHLAWQGARRIAHPSARHRSTPGCPLATADASLPAPGD